MIRLRDPKTWISGFIVFHVLALGLCEFPGSSPVRRMLAEPFRGYVLFFNLGQNWSMFAPEPSSLNAFIRAEVRFKDGTTGFFDLPRMSKLSLVDRYLKERYRKWAIDNLRSDDYKSYWPAAASYVAREANHNSAVPPVEVSLWRYWTMVENPYKKFVPVGYRIQDEKLEKFKFYTQAIKEEDLK